MKEVQKVFGNDEKLYSDYLYIQWLLYIRKGILGLPLYNVEAKKWGQAHTQGAWVFVQFLLENQEKGNEILKIEFNEDIQDLKIDLNKSNLVIYGRKVVEKILMRLHIWKASANYEEAKIFYDKFSEVNESFLKIRKLIEEKQPPRGLILNHNLNIDENNEVKVTEYEESYLGIIESFINRYTEETNEKIIAQLNKYKDNEFISKF